MAPSKKNNLYFRDAVMAFKYMTGMAPEYLGNKFIFRGNVSGRATRSLQQLNIPLLLGRPDGAQVIK